MLLPLLLMTLNLAQEPILIDCDPGKFTDDNAAITMISRSGRFKIVGVTVVSGNVWANEGLRNARATLQMLGEEDVPVHLGAQLPLVHTAEMSKKERPLEFAGAFDLKRPKPETETAVDFIIGAIEKQPLTILAIGPLTNIAQVLAKRPELATRIKSLVIMGGNVYVPGNATKAAEFNFWFDPDAARDVLRAPIANKVLIGLDVCNKAAYGRETFDRIAGGSSGVARIYREQFGFGFPGFLKNPQAKGYLWDELAAAYLIDPSIVTSEMSMYLEADAVFGKNYGRVIEAKTGKTKSRVPLDVDVSRCIELYVKLLK